MTSVSIKPKVHSYSSLKKKYPQALRYGIQNFACEIEPELVDFLNRTASIFEVNYQCRTYFVIDENTITNDKLDIIAYFSISLTAVQLKSTLSKKKKKDLTNNIPNRDNLQAIPGYLIAQLGRNDMYSHFQYPGEELLNSCLNTIKTIQELVGITLVVVECKTELFKKFYAKHKFKSLYSSNSKNYETIFAYEKFKSV